MNTTLLLALAKKLRKVSPKQFNMNSWIGSDWKGTDPNFKCGTSACAMGWAYSVPAIRKAGLRFTDLGTPEWPIWAVAYRDPKSKQLRDVDDWTAVAGRIFGINRITARKLFMPDEGFDDTSPTAKADQIETLVRRARKRKSR